MKDNFKIGALFGNINCMKILFSHSYLKKKYYIVPRILVYPFAFLTKVYGFPPPPFRSSKSRKKSEKFVINKILEEKIDSFMEFGSGYGKAALTISQASCSSGICIDTDEEDINTLNALAKNLNLSCIGIAKDIMDIDLAFNSMDLIFSIEVMEHIENDRILLEKIYSWLKPGGCFIFQTPFHFSQKQDKTEHKFGHVRNGYSEDSFEKMNNGLFKFKYYRIGKRRDLCPFCNVKYTRNHPLKLCGAPQFLDW